MAALTNQKTLLQIQQEISETCFKKNYPNTVLDVEDQPGITRLTQLINDAYQEFSTEYAWSWRFVENGALQTVAGQQTPYDLADNCEELLWMTIPLYQQRLWATEFAQWLTNYPGLYTNYGNAKPWTYIEAPYAQNNGKQVYLFPAADGGTNGAGYQVQYGYMARVPLLVNPTDTIQAPPEYQDAIINRAILKTWRFVGDARAAMYDDSPGKDTYASRRYNNLWIKNQKFAEAVNFWRNIRVERAFTSAMDINRVLFSYGG